MHHPETEKMKKYAEDHPLMTGFIKVLGWGLRPGVMLSDTYNQRHNPDEYEKSLVERATPLHTKMKLGATAILDRLGMTGSVHKE